MYTNSKKILSVLFLFTLLKCTTPDVEIVLANNNLLETVDEFGNVVQKVELYFKNNLSDTIILRLIRENEIGDIQPLSGTIVDCEVEGLGIRGAVDYISGKIDTLLPGSQKRVCLQLTRFSVPSHNCGISFATVGYEFLKDDRSRPYDNNYMYAQVPIVRNHNGKLMLCEVLRGYDEKSLPKAQKLGEEISLDLICGEC